MVLTTLVNHSDDYTNKQCTKRMKEHAIVKLTETEAEILRFDQFLRKKDTDTDAVSKLMVEMFLLWFLLLC